MKVLLHIGLHKTGSTYLQHNVFNNLDPNICTYNPVRILTPLMHALTLNDMDELTERDIRLLERTIHYYLGTIDTPVLFLSDELMCCNMYQFNYLTHRDLLKRLFPDAEIVLFLRFQTDWLRSVYNQALQNGNVSTVKDFFYFDDKYDIVHPKKVRDVTMNVFDVDYCRLIESYREAFSEEKIHLFFFENFKDDNKQFINEFMLKLDLLNVELVKPSWSSVNKSHSALACQITVILFRIAEFLKISWLLPSRGKYERLMLKLIRNRTFKKDLSLNIIEIDDDLLDWSTAKKKYKSGKILFIFLRKFIRRIRIFSIWRFFIGNIFDRIIYVDWDILENADIKRRMDKHFYNQNRTLRKQIYPLELPENYIE